MKTFYKLIFSVLAVICLSPVSTGQESRESISRELVFAGPDASNVLMVRNVFGSVHVNGYPGNSVLIDVKKSIRADAQEDLEEGVEDIQLGILETGDTIILYVDSPWSVLKREKNRVNYYMDFKGSDIGYEFNLDFTIKIPYGIKLNVSTINNGDVRIREPRSEVHAYNINGSVYLEDISDITRANTVNGVIEANYTKNPLGDCSYSTVNGDITLTFLPDLSADISYESMNGDMYTNFNNIERLAPRVKTEKKETDRGTVYRVELNPSVRIGDGDIQLKFNTLNGDMIIKKSE